VTSGPPSCLSPALGARLLRDHGERRVRLYATAKGDYVLERVGRRPLASAGALAPLFRAHEIRLMTNAGAEVNGAGVGECDARAPGTNAGTCMALTFRSEPEDLGALAERVGRIFADAGDACFGVTIEVVGPINLL
jgi:hypothetical protein